MKFDSFQLAVLLLPLASAKLGAPQRADEEHRPSPRKLHEEDGGPYVLFHSNPNLGRCEGDCDRDSDCAGDLVCFERDSHDAVPGCSGGSLDSSENDYCIRKTDDISDPIHPDDPPVTFIDNFSELGICRGDCDVDSDCEGDLVCFQRDAYEAVPGCRGGSSDGSQTDYCVKSSFLWWDEMSSNSLEECREQGLCGECAACSTNDDCIGAFVCFQSEGIFPVPGCSGWEHNDPSFSGGHCVHPKYEVKSKTSSYPLNECAGDCDGDSDCSGDLVCFHREEDEKKAVPGCVGGENDSTKTDYCVYSPFVIDYIGRYQSYGGDELDVSTLFPLSGCEGDCDEDSDCRGDLVCYQRDAHEAVPGCHGGEQDGSATDYCVQPGAICVAEAINCGLNPGSWEDFEDLDCDLCCHGYHYYLDWNNQHKAYCKEAERIWTTDHTFRPASGCTTDSIHCGLNPGSWEDYDDLDCDNCCYGYHAYLDKDNENKAYCKQAANEYE